MKKAILVILLAGGALYAQTKPQIEEQIFIIIGKMHLQIEFLQTENTQLKQENAQLKKALEAKAQ